MTVEISSCPPRLPSIRGSYPGIKRAAGTQLATFSECMRQIGCHEEASDWLHARYLDAASLNVPHQALKPNIPASPYAAECSVKVTLLFALAWLAILAMEAL